MHDQYTAGLIDGEGCIRLMESKRGVVRVSVEVQMSAKALPILQRLHSTYGGNTLAHKRDNRTQTRAETWSWRMGGMEAIDFLKRIKPYLILKPEQAELAIWFHETVSKMPHGPGKGRPWSEEMKALGQRARGRMSELNRKGPERKTIPGKLPLATLEGTQWVTQQLMLDGLPDVFTGPFPKHGAMIDGQIFELDPPMPRITANASSSWLPTPRAADPKASMGSPGAARHVAKGNGSLAEVIGVHLPTPTANDTKGAAQPPGRTRDGRVRPDSDERLAGAVQKFLPTPKANDFRDSNSPSESRRKDPALTAVSVHFPESTGATTDLLFAVGND